MNLEELRAHLKTVDYDELMTILSVVLAESTKRMSDAAIEERRRR